MIDHYLAFGDSISIDEYAGPQLGAASLLHRNRDRWPEFAGQDLISVYPNCSYKRLAFDGSTLVGLWMQLEKAPALQGNVFVSVTIGGNYVLAAWGSAFGHRL